ncbi:MAG TPA: hypothetical protein VE666_15325 [Mycobacterium sp.]|nr:hypothetical protein [Mycobacterium sp.]
MDDLMVPETVHTPLGELITGLEDVAALAIPYTRLPTRARNAYAADFARWSDIAGQSVHSLLSRPWAGESTVRAMLAAAQDAVANHRAAATGQRVGPAAAVRRLLEELDQRERVMVSARLWAPRPLTQPAVAQRLGVATAWVNRNQPRAVAKFAELLADPIHREVGEHAAELGRRLGPYAPADVVVTELGRLDIDPAGEAARVLLHVAGPYVRQGEWYENTTTGGAQSAAAAADAVFDRCPAPSTQTLLDGLTAAGMPLDAAAGYLRSRTDWRRFGDVWVRWGDSAGSKAEAVLHVRGAPATPQDIFAAIGAGPTTLKAVREALYAEQRFVRASRLTWGLRVWGIEEYAGISEEMAARIDASGGTMRIDELIAALRSRFPGVAESSIRTHLSGSLAFITEGDTVRRRTDGDDWPPAPSLYTAQGHLATATTKYGWRWTSTPMCCAGRGSPCIPRWPLRWACDRGSGAYSPARTARCRSAGGCRRRTDRTSDPCGHTPTRSPPPQPTASCWSSGSRKPRCTWSGSAPKSAGSRGCSGYSVAPCACRPRRWQQPSAAGAPTPWRCYASAATTTSPTSSTANAATVRTRSLVRAFTSAHQISRTTAILSKQAPRRLRDTRRALQYVDSSHQSRSR